MSRGPQKGEKEGEKREKEKKTEREKGKKGRKEGENGFDRYSITRLNRNSRGRPFYFGLEIFRFNKSTVKTKITGPADFLRFNRIMPKRDETVSTCITISVSHNGYLPLTYSLIMSSTAAVLPG